MTPVFILGIDPGLHGGLAFYDELHPENSILLDMPILDKRLNAAALADIIQRRALYTPHAVIENVSSRPRQAGAFSFGLYTGIVHGILASCRIPLALVSPSQWKPAMGLTLQKNETKPENKTRARALASQLFPQLADQFRLVKDDGKAEALLLAVYYASQRRPQCTT